MFRRKDDRQASSSSVEKNKCLMNFCIFVFVLSFFLFLNGFFLNAASANGLGSNGKIDLTLPFSRCPTYPIYRNNDGTENFASDKNKEFVFFTSEDKLYLWDLTTRGYLWNTELGIKIVSNIVVNNDSLYMIVGRKSVKPAILNNETERGGAEQLKTETFFLRDTNKLTGLTNRETILNLPDGGEKDFFLDLKKERLIIAARNGALLIFNFDSPNRTLVDKSRGGVKMITKPFFAEDALIAGTSDNKIITIRYDGSGSYEIQTPAAVSAVVGTPDGKIIYGDERGGIFALGKNGKKVIWKFRAGGRIADITPTTYGVLVYSFDNYIYFVSAASGKRVWKKRMPGRIYPKPLITGDFAVITNFSASEADVIELKKGAVVNRFFLEPDNVFDGAVSLFENSLVFSTIKGLTEFSSLSGKCSEK